MPHSGSEIVDFIATVLARDLWQVEVDKVAIKVKGYNDLNPIDYLKKLKIYSQKVDDFLF
ncbi:hypothetical protein ACLIA0_10155 [Bacillaceae bacterium W0354]